MEHAESERADKSAEGKREATAEPKSKPDFSGGAKRCKVLVWEEEVDGVVIVSTKDEEN